MSKTALKKEVSVQEAKTDFDRIIALVEQGETEVVLTQAGKTIARIVAPDDVVGEAKSRFFTQAADLQRAFRDEPTRDLEAKIDEAVRQVRQKRRSGAAVARA